MRRGAATIASIGDEDCTSLGGIITVVSATVNHGNKFAEYMYLHFTMLVHHSQMNARHLPVTSRLCIYVFTMLARHS